MATDKHPEARIYESRNVELEYIQDLDGRTELIKIRVDGQPLIDLGEAAIQSMRDILGTEAAGPQPRRGLDIPDYSVDAELPTYWGEPEHFEEARTVALVNIARRLEEISGHLEDLAE